MGFICLKMYAKLVQAPPHSAILVMVHPWYPWMPPLGLAYVSTYLRAKGYAPLVYDFNAKLYNSLPDQKRKYWDVSTISRIPFPELVNILREEFSSQIEELTQILIQRPEPIVGFSVNYLNISIASQIARSIKENCKGKLIVFGGPGCFWEYNRNEIPPGCVDIFVIGEGERTFYQIVDNFYRGEDISRIKGTIVNSNGKSINNLPPILIQDLNQLPFPTFEEFELSDYGCGEGNITTLPLLTSRGCISKCSFCIDYMMCGHYRMREPEHVVTEIQHHINVNKVRNFSFNDLLCNGQLKKLERLCEFIVERGLDIQWGSYGMARGDMTLELLKKMKQAGCTTICYGIESGSDSVLKLMGKLYSSADAQKVLRLTHQAGIKATFNIIIGHPGEGKKEFKETLNFIKRNRKYIDGIINVSTLFINPTARLGKEPSKFELYFPRNAYSFKLVTLKKILFPRFYKIFGTSAPVSELKGIDLSEFVDNRGNTKPVRLKRLVKTLKFILRLGLFKEDPIINVYATEDRKVSETIQKVSERWTIRNKDILLKCNYKGFIKIFYKDTLLTVGSGLNLAFRIKDRWQDTSQFTWEIRKINSTTLKVFISVPELGMFQDWILKLGKDYIVWRIDGGFKNKNFLPDEIKLGIQIPALYKYWISSPYAGRFPELGEEWRSLELKVQKRVALYPSDKDLSTFFGLRLRKLKSSLPLDLRLENLPQRLGFRYVNFRSSHFKINAQKKFKLVLRLELEKKEGKEYLEEVQLHPYRVGIKKWYSPQLWKELETEVSKILTCPNSYLWVKLCRGLKIFFKNREITSGFGGNVSFRINGTLYDTSQVNWNSLSLKNCWIFNIYWSEENLNLLWKLKIKRNKLIWEYKLTSLEPLELEELKFSILLSKSYRYWALDGTRGALPDPLGGKWQFVPLQKIKAQKILLKSESQDIPEFFCLKSKPGYFQLEVPNPESLNGNFLHALWERVSLKRSQGLKFRYVLEFKE